MGTKLVKDGDQQVKIHKKCIKNCTFAVQKKKEVGLRSAVVIRNSAFKCFIQGAVFTAWLAGGPPVEQLSDVDSCLCSDSV